MHLSNEAGASSDTDNFHCRSAVLSADVKRELKMEVDDEKAWTDDGQKRTQCNSASDSPGEACDVGFQGTRQDEVQPCLRNAGSSDDRAGFEQTEEELYPVSRLRRSGKSFPKDLQHLDTKEFGSAAVSDVATDSGTSRLESYTCSRLEASRPYQRELQNIDARKDWKMLGSWSSNTGDGRTGHVSGGTGRTSGPTIVGHQTASHERSDEVILSTPFGTFHRAPLSFWPAKSIGEEQCSGSSHRSSASDGVSAFNVNTQHCDRRHSSPYERDAALSAPNMSARGSETKTPRKVIIQSQGSWLFLSVICC